MKLLITFKKHLHKGKFYGTYYAYKNGINTYLLISHSENGKSNDFYCMADTDSPYYEIFDPATRKSLEAAKNFIISFIKNNEHNRPL